MPRLDGVDPLFYSPVATPFAPFGKGQNMPSGRNEKLLEAGRAASAGYFMIVSMLLGAGGGCWADQHWGFQPWGILVGSGLGLTAGFRELYLISRQVHLNKPATREGRHGG